MYVFKYRGTVRLIKCLLAELKSRWFLIYRTLKFKIKEIIEKFFSYILYIYQVFLLNFYTVICHYMPPICIIKAKFKSLNIDGNTVFYFIVLHRNQSIGVISGNLGRQLTGSSCPIQSE